MTDLCHTFDSVLFFPRGLNLAHITTLRKRSGTITWDEKCELSLKTGPEPDSFCVLNGYLPIYLNQSYKIDICINVAFSVPCHGLTQLVGMGDSASGVFVGYDGLQFGMCLKKGGKQRQWVLQITSPCTSEGSVTIRLLDVEHVVSVVAGTTPMQLMYAIGSCATIADAGIRAYVCFDRITLRTQESENFAPLSEDALLLGDTGAVGTLLVAVAGCAADETWAYRENFNGSLKQNTDNLQLTNMNVFQLTFSRWSSACINLCVLNTSNDTMIPLHSLYPGSGGFNTSVPYLPRILIKKETGAHLEDGICTLRTSMASASSGTPSTATNVTWFSTNFVYDASISNTNSVVGVMTVPLLSAGVPNRVTAVISEVRVNVRTTIPLKISLIVNGRVDNMIATQQHLPWSCMRHATASSDITVVGGLPAAAMYVREEGGEYVLKPEQLWLAPGSNLSLSVTRSDKVVSSELLRSTLDMVVLWSEV